MDKIDKNWIYTIKFHIKILLSFIWGSTLLAQGPPPETKNIIPVYTYFIVNKVPHDFNAYTQGLVFSDGFLYESTGRRGQSSLIGTSSCLTCP